MDAATESAATCWSVGHDPTYVPIMVFERRPAIFLRVCARCGRRLPEPSPTTEKD